MPVTIDVSQLGAELKRQRDARDLSLRNVWKETNISPATLSRIERGSVVPEFQIVEKLAEWLGVTVSTSSSSAPSVKTDEDLKRVITVHLRANKKLPESVARAIADAYDVVVRYELEQRRKPKKP